VRPYQQTTVPCFEVPVAAPGPDSFHGEPSLLQDFAAMVGQGPIADRTHERLGESDRGVILLRQQLLQDVERVRLGEDPTGVLRDEARNRRIPLPRMPRDSTVLARGVLPDAVAQEVDQLLALHSQ
jgi:5,5'-dehydrodivanillate O-demethylase